MLKHTVAAVAILLSACGPAIGSETAQSMVVPIDEAGIAAQDETLADGVVTRDELRDAVDAEIACLEAAGLTTTRPVWNDMLQRYDYSIRLGRPGEDTTESERAYEACHQSHLRLVAMEWARTADTSEFEQALAAANQACVEDGGSSRTYDELIERLYQGTATASEEALLSECSARTISEVLDGDDAGESKGP